VPSHSANRTSPRVAGCDGLTTTPARNSPATRQSPSPARRRHEEPSLSLSAGSPRYVIDISAMASQTGTHLPMATPLRNVSCAEPPDLREAAIAWCDSCSDLARNLASGLRSGLDLEELRPVAVEKARAALRLTELLAELFEGDPPGWK
jgi:hypothetical protein